MVFGKYGRRILTCLVQRKKKKNEGINNQSWTWCVCVCVYVEGAVKRGRKRDVFF